MNPYTITSLEPDSSGVYTIMEDGFWSVGFVDTTYGFTVVGSKFQKEGHTYYLVGGIYPIKKGARLKPLDLAVFWPVKK